MAKSDTLTAWGRLKIFLMLIIGAFYLAFDIFEGLFNLGYVDEVLGMGVGALSYLLLFKTGEVNTWQPWVVTALWVFTNVVDWIVATGSRVDELVTALVLVVVAIIAGWPIIKRFRLAPVDG